MKVLETLLSLFLLIALVYIFPFKSIPLRPAECAPNDQDRYTYSPHRFLTLSPCLHVTGVVSSLFIGAADGDAFFDLVVDPPFRNLLNAMNERNTGGGLHIESVCYVDVKLEDDNLPAYYTCRMDPDPYRGVMPKVGDHIWAEGRWLWDMNHGGHAELHPLYRWGKLQ